MSAEYVPERGDIISVVVGSRRGREQRARMLVLSPKTYNAHTGLCVACGVSAKSASELPFGVRVAVGARHNTVLVDQLLAADWSQRQAKFVAKAGAAAMRTVTLKLGLLLPVAS